MSKELIRKIGIMGFGNMGLIIGERLKPYSNKYQLFIFDKDAKKTEQVSGLAVAKNNLDLLSSADTVILAIKPQDFEGMLHEIKGHVSGQLVVSIAAAITTDYIEKYLGKVRVIRVMPNMPARIGKGISCVCKGKFAGEEDLLSAQEIFIYLGETLVLNEDMMNAATAISGSGPGYFYDLIQARNIDPNDRVALENFAWEIFIPELSSSAKSLGFNEEQAKLLAVATTEGSVSLLQTTGLSPKELVTQVTSKGGTTEAGLEVLRRGGSLEEAVQAAGKRAEELSIKSTMVDWLNYEKRSRFGR